MPPVAVDDAFGARPGRATVLPVLLNDYDPNGDVLVIERPRGDRRGARAHRPHQRAPAAAAHAARRRDGSLTFGYTISDGRGGTAPRRSSSRPRRRRELAARAGAPTDAVVQSGGRVTTQVLGDWVDPDGDPMYLPSRTVDAPDAVSYKPEGTSSTPTPGTGGASKLVTTGRLRRHGRGHRQPRRHGARRGQVPIIADPFVVLAYAGQEVTIRPLEHVRGGNGPLRLSNVPAKADVDDHADYEAGTFRFESDQAARTTSSTSSPTACSPSPASSGSMSRRRRTRTPSRSRSPRRSSSVPAQRAGRCRRHRHRSGRRRAARHRRHEPPGRLGRPGRDSRAALLRVTLEAPLDASGHFNYRVSNGLAEAEGAITVVECPRRRIQPPVAHRRHDHGARRATRSTSRCSPTTSTRMADLTLCRACRRTCRTAPACCSRRATSALPRAGQTGNFTAAYPVAGPDGQTATAQVKIAVREPDAATNNPPVPRPSPPACSPARRCDHDPALRHRSGRRRRAAARPGDQPAEGRGDRRSTATRSSTRPATTRPAPTPSPTRSSTRSAPAHRHGAHRHQPAARRRAQPGRDRGRRHRAPGRHRLGSGARERLRPRRQPAARRVRGAERRGDRRPRSSTTSCGSRRRRAGQLRRDLHDRERARRHEPELHPGDGGSECPARLPGRERHGAHALRHPGSRHRRRRRARQRLLRRRRPASTSGCRCTRAMGHRARSPPTSGIEVTCSATRARSSRSRSPTPTTRRCSAMRSSGCRARRRAAADRPHAPSRSR